MTPNIPDFDTWFFERNGASFEDAYQYHGALFSDSFRALSREMRNYISWVAEQIQSAGEQTK